MDNEELQKNIALYYSKLSPKLQEIFSSMSWLETLRNISLKHDLDKSQQETLGTETTLVLLGIIHADEYEKNLKMELGLEPVFIDQILKEINESVLKPIRPELLSTYENNINTEEDDTENFDGELDKRFDALPEGIKNSITEAKYYETLYGIAKENALNVEQSGLLEGALTNVILGAIPNNKFEDKIKDILKIPTEKAHTIVETINEKILKEIRRKMGDPIENTPTSTEEQKNTDVLKSAGIEIIGGTPPSPLKEEGSEMKSEEVANPLPQIEKLELKGEVHSMLAKKFDGLSHHDVTKTEHTIENITKVSTTPSPKIGIPKVDPYREIPE